MAWWWRSPDCVDFYQGVFHHPVSRASARGIFIFRRCMVWHLRFLISLDYNLLHLWFLEDPRNTRLAHPWCYLYSIPLASSESVLLLLEACYVFAGSYWAYLIGIYLAFFGFHYGAPAWRVSGVPCYSRLLVCWRFSGALNLLPIVWPDV